MSFRRKIRTRAVAVLLAALSTTVLQVADGRAEGIERDVPARLAQPASPNPMHPIFAPLDSAGTPIAISGHSVSSERTCGGCHDVRSILAHNDHWTESVRVECASCHFDGGRFPAGSESYDPEGRLRREALRLSSPRDAQCAACHGIVHPGRDPLEIPADFGLRPEGDHTYLLTLRTGEVISGQNISESHLNLRGKDGRAYPWDAHARRLVTCVDCHYSGNNPMNAGVKRSRPGFLVDDPRHMDLSEYLRRPDHELVAADCQSCHDPLEVHNFLPYKQRHLEVLACRSCHVPELLGPAMRLVDSTVVTASGSPALSLRGFDMEAGESLNTAYLSGYSPVLRRARDGSGRWKLAPFNAVSSFAWIAGSAGRRVPWETVTRAFLKDGRFDASILSALDVNGDGDLDGAELRLDTPVKAEAVRARLAELGVVEPRIGSTVSYYPVRHGVQSGAQVMHDCNTCHAPGGRLAAGLPLAPYMPAGLSAGPLAASPDPPGLHVFGHARGGWMDRVGFLLFVAVVLAVAVHATVRFLTRRSRRTSHAPLERVYLYTTYERIWHWLMAGSVLVLMFTGLQVHFTGDNAIMPLPRAIALHNVFAFILVTNGFLSLFYHVTSRAIHRFLPQREAMLTRILDQARFYTSGIFLGRPHPSPKTVEQRLNPLQQVTYLTLLNVLFPMQVLTGTLIWGMSRWPDLADRMGGLGVLAPLHNLGAWLFLAFIVLHVYLTTTGHTLTSNLRAMVDGYDEIVPERIARKGDAGA
jgi:thiosulfate reductase cytochrome b subunit